MSRSDGKQILLAGGTGLAGSGVARALLAHGASERRLRISHRGPLDPRQRLPGVEYLQADLRNEADVGAALHGCGCVVMAAAVTGGARLAHERPAAQLTDNVIMDLRLFEALAEAGVQRLIYVSTASVYQDLSGAIREDDLDLNLDPPAAWEGPGWANRFAERLCRFWHRRTGLEVVIARLANVFGPYGRFDPAVSNVVAALVRKAVDRLDPFTVWGSPEVTRDILYADDFGEAIVSMIERRDIVCDVFNIGSGRRTTVGEIAGWALDFAGHRPSAIAYEQTPFQPPPFRALDCRKAAEILGWRPRIGVEEGMRRTVSWWSENRDWWTR